MSSSENAHACTTVLGGMSVAEVKKLREECKKLETRLALLETAARHLLDHLKSGEAGPICAEDSDTRSSCTQCETTYAFMTRVEDAMSSKWIHLDPQFIEEMDQLEIKYGPVSAGGLAADLGMLSKNEKEKEERNHD